MRRQRRSITDIICENCKYLPTKRSRNKRKPIPKESDVKTFNYTAHLWDIRWLRHCARKTRLLTKIEVTNKKASSEL
ncbi:NinE family protein [Escherichia coli]|nr:NinE family protein [Escherichia coli]RNJ28172.1 NinE family protein [Escherichia coli]